MARTTLVIDEQLLKEAQRLSGAKTKKEAIEIALREFVRRMRLRKIAAHAGRVELVLSQEELRRIREERQC
ncbi:type II toxin-antitoxin system VapB family antitoxin [Candidatus Pyrohabitans sp.]